MCSHVDRGEQESCRGGSDVANTRAFRVASLKCCFSAISLHANLIMRTVLLGRFFLKHGLRSPLRHRFSSTWRSPPKTTPPRRPTPIISGVLIAALAPSAFLKLAEDSEGHKKTGEMQMLEASRNEIRKAVSPDAKGLSRACQSVSVFFYYYVYDPIATGFRFLHLVVIFAPVIITIPAIWIGKSVESLNGARSGTLWWYRFLVKAMERAGPAFIKVSILLARDNQHC